MHIKDKFEALRSRLEEIDHACAQPEVARDVAQYQKLLRERAQLEPKVKTYDAYMEILKNIAQAREMESDPELKAMAADEVKALTTQLAQLEGEMKRMLLPKDARDDRSVIMEVRAGAGGDEAALFAADLVRMYARFGERHGFKVEPIVVSETDLHGVKEATFSLSGMGAYARMKYESGVHRVQRIPVTETSGRPHTSTATVAVLPEAEDVEVDVSPEDIRIDTYRASGHGGQYINKTDSAVRITHLKTGVVVTCQDEKSQLKNKEKAMKVLKSRLFDLFSAQNDAAYAAVRRAQVGSGERNERIRTYNFREGRVTDHRVGLTLYRIDEIIDGDLDEIIDALAMKEQEQLLQSLE